MEKESVDFVIIYGKQHLKKGFTTEILRQKDFMEKRYKTRKMILVKLKKEEP